MAGDLLGATSRARVGGSGFTVFTWNSKPIAFARQLSHSSPKPVAEPTPIHPLDSAYAVEIAVPLAAGPGTLQVELYELYGRQVWDELVEFAGQFGPQGATDIVEVFYRVANTPQPITMVKYIKPPLIRGKKMAPYTFEYHNCVITDIGDGESVEVGTMEILKTVNIMYTHVTRGGRNIFSGGSQVNLPNDVRDSTNVSFNG